MGGKWFPLDKKPVSTIKNEGFISKLETSFSCAMLCPDTTYQKVNSSIVTKGAMNSFKKMFPLAIMHPPTPPPPPPPLSFIKLP